MSRPTLRQLEYVVALARTLNFREAAEACHVSQPALSTQLQRLEQALGVELFERDTRRVVPTAAGAALAAGAGELLARVDDLVGAARGRSQPLSGTLRLGVIPTIAPYLLPPALVDLRAAFPQLALQIHEGPTQDLLRQLGQGQLDLVLLAREAELGAVELLDLFRDPFHLVVPRGHALARRKRVRAQDLLGEALILLEDGH